MAGANFIFPQGAPRSIEQESLIYATVNEKALRETHQRAVNDYYAPLPAHFNPFQVTLAREQSREDAQIILGQLMHAQQKLEWERTGKWRRKR